MIGIEPGQLLKYIIEPAIGSVGLNSPSAAKLLLGTAAAESYCGRFVKQLGTGPALGIFQMEPATHNDIWESYLAYREGMAEGILAAIGGADWRPPAQRMIWDIRYAAIMARIHYLRVREALPEEDDIADMARYWKRYYNTDVGKGTVEDFIGRCVMLEGIW